MTPANIEDGRLSATSEQLKAVSKLVHDSCFWESWIRL